MPPTHEDRPRILVMDANESNADLLSDFLAKEDYDPMVVTDIEMAGVAIEDASQLAFAIIDIDRFDSPIWPYCERLDNQDVPFIVLSGLQNPSLQQESQEHGANAFVGKPIPKQELRDLIQTTLNS